MRFADLIKRFRKDERGVFLVFFALIAVVLIAASGAVVDFTRVQQARTRAQNALDAAALALQGTINTSGVTASTLQVKAQALLTERIADSSITAVVQSATPDITAGKLTIVGYISVPTYFVQLVGIKDIRSSMLSEVTRASKDLEVSLSIDITGSMAPVGCDWWGKNCTDDKIGDLIDASNMLIDLLVSDTQTPTYSKMAIVPWSYAPNVGSLANSVRGTPTAGVSVSAVTWMSGSALTITGVTRANPAVVTTSGAHGFSVGDYVYITGVVGMTNLNNNIYKVGTLSGSPTVNKFQLKTTSGGNVNSSTWTAFSATGTPRVSKCLQPNCLEVVTTSANHGIASGESVYLTGTVGTTGVNNTSPNVWTPTILTTTTYSLPGTSPSNGIRTSGGTSYCVKYGCSYYRFTGWDSTVRMWQPNNCVTERTTDAYTDAAPSTTALGFNYTSGGADCVSNQIVPMTSTKSTLHAAIGTTDANGDGVKEDYRTRTLQAVGNTAGHLGLAWGWYMLAPNFASLWPSASPAPKAYGSANLIKAIIFMTDGVFNRQYCNGVDDATINCASPNGTSKSQAQTLCTNIKATANHIDLYVVGFDLATDTVTRDFLEACATDSDHFYRADTGDDLEAAFRDIAQNLSDLRISK